MRCPAIRFSVGALSVILAALNLSPASCQDATKAHVAVLRFSNETDSPSYDAACKAATDTLVLTLNQLGRYRVQSEDGAAGGDEALRAKAEEQHLDFIIFGKMSKLASGGIVCSLSVYDRAKGKTSLSQTRKAAGVLDIFEAADALVVSVLESMTGAHIGFGALMLTNTGEKGSYKVLVDGMEMGTDVESLDRILNGRRTVSIEQKRMLGDREIARASVEVKEGDTAELKFAVPYLMEDEKERIEGLRSAIQEGWTDSTKASDVDAEIAELASLLSDVSYSPKLSRYKDEATQLSGEWGLQKSRLGIENAAWEPKLELLDEGGRIYANAKTYPDAERIRKSFEEEASLEATLFELAGGKALGDGDLGKGLECFEDALMVSTRYLKGARMTDYAYAMTTLQGMQTDAGGAGGTQSSQTLKTVFGAWMAAGRRFYGLRDQAESGAARVLVASDMATAVSVDGGSTPKRRWP